VTSDDGMGARIRSARRRKQMTTTELGAAVGVAERTVTRWERGRTLPDTTFLRNLARVLEVNAAWLLGDGEGEETTIEAVA
jgi:transcriptional regulator with XRE-family HTH domain